MTILRSFVSALRRERAGRDPLGDAGERAAARHLRRAGYRLLGRNQRTPIGEVDILARDPDGRTVVIVEVKSRRVGEREAPRPEAALTAHKRRKLVALAHDLARRRGWQDRPLRIDLIAIDFRQGAARPEVRHHVGAVSADGRVGR